MTMLANDFEKGSPGATLTAAGGEGSPDPFSAVTIGPTCQVVYDSLAYRGSLSGKFVQGATPGNALVQFNTGTLIEHYGRCYVYRTAVTAGYHSIVGTSTLGWRIYLAPAGYVMIADSGGGGVANTGNSPPLGQWFRLEWHVIHDLVNGSADLRQFNNPASSTPSAVCSYTAKNNGANVTAMLLGQIGAGNVGEEVRLDGIVVGASAWVGGMSGDAGGQRPAGHFDMGQMFGKG